MYSSKPEIGVSRHETINTGGQQTVLVFGYGRSFGAARWESSQESGSIVTGEIDGDRNRGFMRIYCEDATTKVEGGGAAKNKREYSLNTRDQPPATGYCLRATRG